VQQVEEDEVAQFNCAGVGSFIGNVSWVYDELCASTSCEGAVAISEETGNWGRLRNITSTLTINVSMLRLEPVGRNYTIHCILHENVPPGYNLQGRNAQISVGLEIISRGELMFALCMLLLPHART
jgi:hypothetical protein